jgi:vitamin B12/bleomycin/antimicrobial peptide transport system ATP-binding/permease protein
MTTDGPDDVESKTQSGLMAQVGMMSRALWASPTRSTVLLLAFGIFIVIVATAYGQIRLNSWNQPFYDALSRRDFTEFLTQLGIFGVIAGALLVLNVAQRWLGETLKLQLRKGLAHDLVQNWLVPGRAFRLANAAGPIGVNPDQRMHEDARHLTELSTDLGVGLLQDSILLISFVKILWSISTDFAFHVAGRQIAIPGYMVWAAIAYAGSASVLSYWVGRNLIDRNADRYAREADMRFSLVRVNEHIDAITLAGGEADEARRIEIDIANVLSAMRKLVTGVTNLTWVSAGYGWFTLVAPILVAAPLYFAGAISFGGLMLAAGAFMQVQSSLRWFVDNFSTLADWRATLLRVASFRRAVIGTDVLHDAANRIEFVEGAPGRIQIDDLEITWPTGSSKLQEPHVEVRGGERVLIVSELADAKSLLFRALAGLWPWGAGRVTRPQGEALLYLPRSSYLPPGTLREVLAYPSGVASFDAGAFARVLERLALDRLVPMLDQSHRWDRDLSDSEQQNLAFARALLHAPPWMIIDEAFETLPEDGLARVREVFGKDLARTGIIYIGRPPPDHWFGRMLHLMQEPETHPVAAPAPLVAQPLT